MTASGSNKKRICCRRSNTALSCFFLKALQVASRSCDGLRFGSVLHKERSRMAKGMSPLRLFMRNAPRKTAQDGIDGGSSGLDVTAQSTRQPLGQITESSVRNPLITVAEQTSGGPSTPRAKVKVSSTHGQEKFPHLENSEDFASSINTTPDKTANSQSKGKFTWQHRHGSSVQNTPRDGPPPLSTPPRHSKGGSDGQAANNQDTTLQSVSHFSRGGGTTGGGSVPCTPKTARSVGSKSTTESENGGSQSQNGTPCKSASRSLKYGQQQGSANNSGASGLTNARSTVSQHAITRPIGYLQAAKGVVPHITNQNFVEHHFELEEDASFWRDHNVQVIIRTRPLSNNELSSQGSNRCLKQESPHVVSWLGQPESRFTFDHVAGETITQAKLFDVAGLPMVENCMSGYNSCMFAYGQTGSGKTHTMLGDMENLDRNPSENRGITPRVFEYLFARIRTEQECRRQEHLKFFCKCSFLEIYNEQITDLLEPSSTNLQMREDAKKGVYVENLSEVEVQCVQDVIQLLLQGAANRKVAATNMNRESSRSHSVFTCVVESKWENNAMTNSRYGRLHLVDLAGSERQKSSGAEGGRLKEAANINKSLSTLGLVIMILVDVANGRQRHVPYRDSKLTFLLQDSLGGNSKTIMIANVSPASCCAMETLSTLKFAQRAKFIRNNAIINEDASGDVIALRREIEELKVEVDRLRRERMLRVSSSRILALENGFLVPGQPCGDKFDASTLDSNEIEGSTMDSRNGNMSLQDSIAHKDKQLRSVEAVLAGALRREQQAENVTKKLAAEIEQLNRLVRQREEDSQCSKMMLRFREEKIRRLEGFADNVISAEAFYEDERKNLTDELQLIRGRLDRNPELTRFAMENIRLMEELRRYQEFYDGGERDVLLEEISGLRSQLLDTSDSKVGEDQTIDKLLTPQKRVLVPELSALERENELLLIEVKTYQNELKECRNNLNSCLVANADLSRQVDELQATVTQLESERSQNYESRTLFDSLDEAFPDSFSRGDSLPLLQKERSSADPTTAHMPLQTEDVDLQQKQAVANVEAEVLELRNQLKEAQDLILKLSSEVEEANELLDDRKLKENSSCIAEDDAVVKQGLQERWEKLQEIEMRHSEEITQLQLELDSMEEVLKEERQQRLLADQKIDDLSSQLSATVSKLEQAQGLLEDGSTEERQQRLVAEQRSEELEEVLKEERQQRLLADQTIDDLSSQLSATVSKLGQAQCLVEDGSTEERQQRLVAEQRSEELEQVLKEERQQRLLENQKVDDLSSQLSATVLKLEEAQALAEDSSTEERQQRLVAEQRSEELSNQLSAALLKLEEARCVVEALEGQQLFSINELENLQSEHTELLRRMKQREEGEGEIPKHFQDENTVDDAAVYILEKKLLRTKRGKEEARRINRQFEEEKASRMALDKERELTMSDVETQAALAITTLQSEIFELKEEVSLAVESEASAQLRISHLQEELQRLQEIIGELEEINRCLSDKADEYRNLADEKDAQLRGLEVDWESSASKLIDFLSDGDDALSEAVREMEEIKQSKIQEILRTDDNHVVEKRASAESVQHRLPRVQSMVPEAEGELRTRSDATATEATNFAFEDGQAMIRESEKKSMVAFLMVRELLEKIRDLKAAQHRLVQDNQEAFLREMSKDVQAAALQQQLEDLRHQHTELQDEIALVIGECEDLREQNRARSLELETGNGLRADCIRLEKEVEESCRAIEDKDVENRNLHQQLNDNQVQSTLMSDRYQLLAAARENLQQEQASYLEDNSLKVQHWEEQVRLAERKAMAVLVLSEQLLGVRNALRATNTGLVKEIHDGRLLQAETRATLDTLEKKLEQSARQHKKIADQCELLSEKNADLQQEHSRLLAEAAARVEEGEALLKLSERRAMAAFVVLDDVRGRVTELKTNNTSLALEIGEAQVTSAEKDTALLALRNELSEYSDVTRRHHVLEEAHENLRQDHERLLAESTLRVEEGEALLKLSERKAMGAFVVLEHMADTVKELQTTNTCLAKEIGEAHVTLGEKDTALAALQNEVSEYSDVATRHHALEEAHKNLRQEHERSLAEMALRVEEVEAMVKLSERRAMGAFVVLEDLVERVKELQTKNTCLAKETGEAHVTLGEKDTALVALQNELSEYSAIATKYQVLEEAHVNLRGDHERSLAEMALRIEEGEALVKLSERKAMGAFVVLDGLLERVKDLKTTVTSLSKQFGEATVTLGEKDTVLAALQSELSEYSDIAAKHQALEEAHENLREEHERFLAESAVKMEEEEALVKLSDRKAMGALVVLDALLERVKDLKTTVTSLSKRCGEATVTLGEKDTELAALQSELSKCSDVSAKHLALEEAHENLREEHERFLAEMALKMEEGEVLVKLSERKAMGAFVVLEDLVERVRELQTTNTGLEWQIGEAHVTLGEKDAALAALQNELPESSDVATRHHVLEEAHKNLRGENERLLAETALRVEKVEALVKLSERRAMGAFVVLEDLVERVKELQTSNACLAKQIEVEHMTLGEKDTALAALQNEVSEYSDVATRHHALEEAHKNLREDNETLLSETALRVEEGEALVKLSERRAMGAFVVLEDLVERVKELQTSNACLAKQIEEAHVTLGEKDVALAALQNELSESSDVATRHHVLEEAHKNLRGDNERLLAETALRVEEGEALVKLSERRAMGALVVLEEMVERVKELQTSNACLAMQIEEAHVTLGEKDVTLAALQNELSEYSDFASKYQVLVEAHENLVGDHERLLAETELKVEECDSLVKLSERKAMGAFVVLEDLVERVKGLQTRNTGLAKENGEGELKLIEKSTALAALQKDLCEYSDIARRHQLLEEAHENLREDHERLVQEHHLSTAEGDQAIKLCEKRAMATLVILKQVLDGKKELQDETEKQVMEIQEAHAALQTLEVLKVSKMQLEKKIEEEHDVRLEKESTLQGLQRQLEESHALQKVVCDENQSLLEKQEHLEQQLGNLELGLRNSDSEMRLLQELSATTEQQYTEAYNEALNILMKANSFHEMKSMESMELFMSNVRDGLELLCDEISTVEEAVAKLESVERELGTCRSKVLMLEEENSGNLSAMESYQTEISQLATSLQRKERDLDMTAEKETTCSKNWESERATLVSEKEQSKRDCLERKKMVQDLLLDVQTLDLIVKEAELRVSDMGTSVQAVTVAKEELELENSRLVRAARQGETDFRMNESEMTAIRGDLADVRARLRAAELREQSASERMEELAAAKVECEIERVVMEHEMLQLREEKQKLLSHVSYLNVETENREASTLESFRRSQEALEAVEGRMTAMDEVLARLELSKDKLEHEMAVLEAAASGDALAMEQKELECLEMKRQLGIFVLQITQMQTAIDLAAAEFALEMSNREADSSRIADGKGEGETQAREEFVSALLPSTQGSLTTEAQHLDWTLKQTELKVFEMLKGVKALTVAVEELELEKCRLILAASQAEIRCTEKEQELAATQGELAGLRSQLEEAELHEKSLSEQMEELTGAKLRWEVERADAKRVIEDMRQEKDRIRFNLSDVNVELEEIETAIFDSFRRSEQALEGVEARLRTMDQELGGLEASQRNLENDLALLDSAATISSVALEEKERQYLEMQRRVENAEVQMREMQAVADSVVAEVVLERENWEANKRRMKDENDAREAELREEIAAAELILVATDGSLKVAVENVEDLGLSVRELEEEIFLLNEDAKISLLKVTEQQQQIDSLRGMSMALQAECTEADERIASLNHLREQYLLAETSWRSERVFLTKKLDELEVFAGQIKNDNVSDEGSGVSKRRGELSQCLPERIPGSENEKQFEEAEQNSKQIQVLRAKISEKDRTILSAKKEMQIAIANLKEAELEMDKVHRENHKLTQTQQENKSLIESLTLKFKTAEEEILKREIKIEGCEVELQKVVRVMSDWETNMHDVETEWRKEKEALAQELTEAKLVANEKRTEAGALLQKFQDGQATLREAEDLVDALVKANENAKHDALDWKTEKQSLRIVQGWWMPERDKLVSEVARLETDMHTQKQDIWILCKEEVNGLVATLDHLLAVDKELLELKSNHQQDLDNVAVDMKGLKGDLVAQLLDLEVEMRNTFEDLESVVYELKAAKDQALKDLSDLKVLEEQRVAQSLQTMNSELKGVENERNERQTDLVALNQQLEMVQYLVDQREMDTLAARQAAERSQSLADEKEEEARILERSVEELEKTVYALESQLDILRRESERQRVVRETLEKELDALKHEMGLMQVTIDSQEAQTVRDIHGAETSKTELYRTVIEMKNQQIQARKSVESLQQECAEKDVQLRSCKAHIAELMMGAEKQASENQQKLKTLEAMVEHLKVEERIVNTPGGSVSKAAEKSTGKVKGAGSPFKCIGSGLDKQRSSEIDEELNAAKKRIKELETVAASRQKEVFMLNTKLAEAESMTHDVVRDLLGVKMDIASYATLLNQQQVQRMTEQVRRFKVEDQQKEDELDTLRDRLNEFIEERESWLEEINRRQAEAVAARVSAEKLRLRDETLTAENDKFREDNHTLRQKVADLDDEIKKLSGQQNLQQRIHHHAKIKEENNSMRLQNEDLSGKLRRMEILFTRVNDELARYRTAEGKTPFLNFDEEARLQKKIQETEENRLQLAETLIGLCTGIMQAAGIQRASRDLDPSAAMTALHQLQDRLKSLERELSDSKLKARIAVEKRRLSDLRDFHTPTKAICTNTNFTANQQLPSPISSSR